jgi:hypothetical protein
LLTELNLADNNLGKVVPPEAWSYGYHGDYSGNKFYKHTDGREMKNGTPEGTTSGAIVIAAVIPDMGAISSLNLAKNTIRAEGAKHLSAAIKGHKTLTVLDISSNEIGAYSKDNDGNGPWIASPEGPVAVADAIRDMGAMTSLNLAGNGIGLIDIFPDGWRSKYNGGCYPFVHTDGREQNVPPEGAKSSGVIAIANAIPDMRALIKLDISSNNIGGEQEGELQRICVASGIELAK